MKFLVPLGAIVVCEACNGRQTKERPLDGLNVVVQATRNAADAADAPSRAAAQRRSGSNSEGGRKKERKERKAVEALQTIFSTTGELLLRTLLEALA